MNKQHHLESQIIRSSIKSDRLGMPALERKTPCKKCGAECRLEHCRPCARILRLAQAKPKPRASPEKVANEAKEAKWLAAIVKAARSDGRNLGTLDDRPASAPNTTRNA